jgi:hypothetical protein
MGEMRSRTACVLEAMDVECELVGVRFVVEGVDMRYGDGVVGSLWPLGA